jgi:hypothetical protein
MLAAALAYVLFSASTTQLGTKWYGDVALDDLPAAVLYTMGQPSERSGDATNGMWRYNKPTHIISVTFANGRVSRISCAAVRLADAACPEILGLTNRSSESDVLVALGQPDRLSYRGEMQLIAYDGLGLRFGLMRRQVHTIEVLNDRASVSGVVVQYLRIMVP